VVDWGGGVSASCKPRVQLFTDGGNRWPNSALRYHLLMPVIWHLQDFKVFLVTEA